MKNKDNKSPLDEIKKDNPFKTPEGYFDTFSDRLQQKIKTQEEESASTSVIVMIKPYIAVAAGFLLLFLLWQSIIWYTNNGLKPQTAQNQSQQYQEEFISELENLSETDLYQLDEYMLIAMLEEEHVVEKQEQAVETHSDTVKKNAKKETKTETPKKKDKFDEEVSDEEIMEYLIEENVDYSILIDEL